MNNTLTAHTIVQALGWTLIHSLWQGSLIALGVFALSRTATSPRRYNALCAGLITLLLACLVTFGFELRKSAPGIPSYTVETSIKANQEFPGLNGTSATNGTPIQSGPTWNGFVNTVAVLWLLGVPFMAVRAARAAWNVRFLRLNARHWEDESWQTKVRQWAVELRISKTVRLCLTTLNDVPAVIGHFKPIILLPAAIVTQLSPAQVEALILHELMHISRNDYLVSILQLACETLLFFHPVAWWLSRSLREEREYCCDEAVAARQRGSMQYAKALVALEELRVHSSGLLVVGAGGGSLKVRISRLLAPQIAPVRRGGWTVSICSLVLMGTLTFWCWPPAVAQTPGPKNLFQVRRVVEEGGEELPFLRDKQFPAKLRVSKDIIVDESHVTEAKVSHDVPSGRAEIFVRLNNEGAARFSKATKDNIGNQVAVVINQQIVSAPRIATQIPGGSLTINGNFSDEEMAQLAEKLNPAPKVNNTLQEPAVKLEAYFIKTANDPVALFNLHSPIDSGSDDISSWTLTREQARTLIEGARQNAAAKLIAAPMITTSLGKAARVEIGDVPGQENVFSVNARGYVLTKDPAEQSATLIGQSIELLPELSNEHWIIAGKLSDREKVTLKNGTSPGPATFIRTIHSSPLYFTIPKTATFALTQKSKSPGPESYLLLLVVPSVGDGK
ncbi:MAG: peptidase BlaR1 [Verrucomicrobiales bacterium]|nr:peptidase BlaR1 [Verrucomicrobiales bacterium]